MKFYNTLSIDLLYLAESKGLEPLDRYRNRRFSKPLP